jgi:phosphoribosyl-dephospho-CoA transferase
MDQLQRNQLVWLTDGAWQALINRSSDPQTQVILSHWHQHQLPVVVTRQHGALSAGQVSLGLPAPAQWSRRKLALEVPQNAIEASHRFPPLSQIASANGWDGAVVELNRALIQSGVEAEVYGSFAWQFLTRLSYVHPASDLDISLQVRHLDQARQVLDLLSHADLPQRLDGEIVFANGQAVAWRELAQLLDGQVSQVLVKDHTRVALMSLNALGDLNLDSSVDRSITPIRD